MNTTQEPHTHNSNEDSSFTKSCGTLGDIHPHVTGEGRVDIDVRDKFSKGLGISFGIHVLFISFFILKAAFFDAPQIDFSQAIRVDMVGLPTKAQDKQLPTKEKEAQSNQVKERHQEKAAEKNVQKTVEKTKPKETSTPQLPSKVAMKIEAKPSKPTEGIKLEKNKNTQKSAIDKLKTEAAFEKLEKDVEEERMKQLQSKGKEALGAQKYRGNAVSPGTELTGLAKLQHDQYASDLDHHIKEFWALPEWLANRDYRAQVKVYFNERGMIIRRKIVKSSGNPSYDEEVLATIDRSAPFPPPPSKLVSIVEIDGILIGFPE